MTDKSPGANTKPCLCGDMRVKDCAIQCEVCCDWYHRCEIKDGFEIDAYTCPECEAEQQQQRDIDAEEEHEANKVAEAFPTYCQELLLGERIKEEDKGQYYLQRAEDFLTPERRRIISDHRRRKKAPQPRCWYNANHPDLFPACSGDGECPTCLHSYYGDHILKRRR